LPPFDDLTHEEYIIAQIAPQNQHNDCFWLQFHITGNGTEWIDEDLPIPTYHEIINKGYILAYALDGFFGTQNGSQYLNDIIARFLVTFRDFKPSRLPYKPKIEESGNYYPKIYKLRELSALRSLANKKLPRAAADKFEDFTFWAIKFYCEDLIRSQGMATAEQLINFAYNNFENRERSTLKAKCRSVWNWYDQRDWQLQESSYKRKYKDNDEGLKVTRQERALKNAKIAEERSRRKILNCINGLMADHYKKKSGSWHIGKIAADTGLTEKTVSKHLKELEA